MGRKYKEKHSIDRDGHIKSVPLGKMHISSRHAQRAKISESWVDYLLSRFDLDKFGTPVLSHRYGEFYIMDGQHRIEALKRWLGVGWEKQTIECLVYDNLSEAEEAEKFLSMNDVLHVNPYDKFRIAVHAGRVDEVHIQKIVEGARLCISKDKVDGAVGCVSTLKRVYLRSDGDTLARTLRITRDGFGDAGLIALVIDGIAHLCQRYNGVIDEDAAIQRLSATRGGMNGLLNNAEVLHKQTGNAKAQCVAAAAVDIINKNRKRGVKKLPSWWQSA